MCHQTDAAGGAADAFSGNVCVPWCGCHVVPGGMPRRCVGLCGSRAGVPLWGACSLLRALESQLVCPGASSPPQEGGPLSPLGGVRVGEHLCPRARTDSFFLFGGSSP